MRRPAIAVFLLAQAGCVQSRQKPALARGADYLWSEQAADGGWHSRTYGLLCSGQSLTPFVLEALLEIPEDVYPRPAAKVDGAIAFIRRNTTSAGVVGMMDPAIPDYPNYATALSLRVLCRWRPTGWERDAARIVECLRRQQFTEQNGWGREDRAYGAWGMGGAELRPPDTGHVDLSMTRHVLEALRAAGIPASDPVFERARVFLQRCQNFDTRRSSADGGFFFSTTEFDTNKAGHDGKNFRSYGTTTADGILALIAAGASPDDARLRAAARWLTSHHRDMDVPGFIGEAYQRWPRGLSFYYAAVSTRTFRTLQLTVDRRVADGLEKMQRPDGSWANTENLVKEDDPLIATPFAVRALLVDRAMR
jgi:hypothetical protein